MLSFCIHSKSVPHREQVHIEWILPAGGYAVTKTLARDINDRLKTTRLIRRLIRRGRKEEGNSMVEMALVCAFVYLPLLFGIFQVSYGVYVYNFVCGAAHQAARYAAVRGANSCVIQSTFVDCNLNPSGSTNSTSSATTGSGILQNYVVTLGSMGIDPNQITVTANWYNVTFDNSGAFSVASWSAPACTSSTGCNNVGDAVLVQIVYQFPLHIPFWGNKSIPIASTSQAVIME
jgi:Flp pilus assembly protein TadG